MVKQPTKLKMEEKVHQTIQSKDLLSPGDHIVVAVSGGPDSVALLACLVALSGRWDWEISIGHVNHGLRGRESDEDAEFIEHLGKHFDVPVHTHEARLNKQDVKLSKQSLQAYAREIRYQAVEEILQKCGATKIATGHTVDDQAETVLMWMLRGSGTGGLSGIPPKRGGRIVRPLLDISRSEIMGYLKKRQLSYRIDSSNRQTAYLRNRLRHDLMPQLKVYTPGIVNVLSRQAEIIRDDHDYLEHVAAEAFQDICATEDETEIQLDRTALLSLPMAIRRRVVRHALQQMTREEPSPRFSVIQQLLDCLERGQSGWTMQLNSVDVGQEYNRLVFSKRETRTSNGSNDCPFQEIGVNIPGEVIWPLTGQCLTMSLNKHDKKNVRQSHSLKMYLDADSFTPELRIRSWRPGDVFCPKGLSGRRKKLQDFFSDIKIPRSHRAKVPLLVAPEGILWVGGLREDERFRVSSLTTSVVTAIITS